MICLPGLSGSRRCHQMESNASDPAHESSATTNSAGGNSTNRTSASSKAVDFVADTVSRAIELAAYMHEHLNSTGNSYKLEDALGMVAEISLSIPKGGSGELRMIIGKTIKHFPAQAAEEGREFKRGERVRIASVGVNTMYVEALS